LIYITRRERFSAAHKLSRPEWSDERNEEVFGKCANVNWHGHNYDLYVTVKGEVNPETGFVIDLKLLSDMIKERVIQHVDHKNINLDTPFMKGQMASTENICIAIWNELAEPIKAEGAELHYIKLQETENNFVEYYG
jgi:6-pyruvoyltetrahydropterin/6-carboxytetrahydropterin synthase